MSKQAVAHSSRLRYSHPSLELLLCFHRLHVPRSSCIHTSGCPCLPWHCQPHLVEARYGGCPSCLSCSSQTRLAGYRFPSTSPSRHSQCLKNNVLFVYLYKSTLISKGLSKSFNIACFVSFSERLACSVGIFQSIPRLSSRIEIPPSASG